MVIIAQEETDNARSAGRQPVHLLVRQIEPRKQKNKKEEAKEETLLADKKKRRRKGRNQRQG